jgi:hypothetical protein
MSDFFENLKNFLETEEGKKSIEDFKLKIEREEAHKDRWVDRMWNRIKDDIDGSIANILDWYESDTYRDREYAMGYEPREGLLWVLLGVAEKYGSEVGDEYEIYANMFTGEMYKLGSYIIQVMHGQGSVIKVDKI